MKTMSKLMLAVMLLWTTGLSAQQTSGETSQRRIKEEGKTIFDPRENDLRSPLLYANSRWCSPYDWRRRLR